MQSAIAQDELTRPADRQYGYRFGCEGVLTIKQVIEALGGISRATVYRRIEDGLLRKGKDMRRSVICRRSLMEYLNSLES